MRAGGRTNAPEAGYVESVSERARRELGAWPSARDGCGDMLLHRSLKLRSTLVYLLLDALKLLTEVIKASLRVLIAPQEERDLIFETRCLADRHSRTHVAPERDRSANTHPMHDGARA